MKCTHAAHMKFLTKITFIMSHSFYEEEEMIDK